VPNPESLRRLGEGQRSEVHFTSMTQEQQAEWDELSDDIAQKLRRNAYALDEVRNTLAEQGFLDMEEAYGSLGYDK
jgi:hypothetical protein